MTANMCISVVRIVKKKKKKKSLPTDPFFFQTCYSKHNFFIFGLNYAWLKSWNKYAKLNPFAKICSHIARLGKLYYPGFCFGYIFTDPCRQPGIKNYGHDDTNCRTYWRCVDGHTSVAKCCKPFHSYNHTLDRCIKDASCKDPCPILDQGKEIV